MHDVDADGIRDAGGLRIAVAGGYFRERAMPEALAAVDAVVPFAEDTPLALILALVGALPNWGYSRGWGYGPSGLVGVALLILVIMTLMGGV